MDTVCLLCCGYTWAMRECGFKGCGRPHRARGYCSGHYQQAQKGVALLPIGDRKQAPATRYASIDEAFWARVRPGAGCWEWQGIKTKGYGVLKHAGQRVYAHRHSLAMSGVDVSGRMVDHLCHNPPCVNPDHLRLADNAVNQQNLRGAKRSNKVGLLGVSKEAGGSSWRAEVKANGKRVRKSFATAEEADVWVREMRSKLHAPRW